MKESNALSVALVPSQTPSLVCCDDCRNNTNDNYCRKSGISSEEGYLCYCYEFHFVNYDERNGWVA